jgi:hypothetical protein
MRKRLVFSLVLITALAGPAASQGAQRGGVHTETQDRLANQGDMELIWNLIGLVGLLGLLGLRRGHPDDSYHPASIE